MIRVSSLALEALFESLQASGIDAESGLRLQEGGSGYVLTVDKPGPYDLIVSHRCATVLILDPETVQRVGDATIEIGRGSEGPEIKLRRRLA